MKLLMKINPILDRSLDLGAILAGVLIIFIMLSVGIEIVMTYFLGRVIFWLHDIIVHSLVYITCLLAAWVLREEGHVRMDLVLNRLNPGTQAVVNIITSILGAIMCLVVTWYGVKVTWDYFQLGYRSVAVLPTPMYLIIAIIPVSTFLLFIQFLRRTFGYLRRRA